MLTSTLKIRLEKDSLGSKEILASALYGIQTLRGAENCPISGEPLLPELVKAYAELKKACAISNNQLGLLPKKIVDPIIRACDEIIAGKHADQFIVDVFQAGAGTSTNMNLNEVIANRALEILKQPKGSYNIISPNDHVNMAQSTNDTYPTAMRLAILLQHPKLDSKLEILEKTFFQKAKEFKNIIKSARTHLQDAVPITLGQEFSAWGQVIKSLRRRITEASREVAILGIGGSAAGTGLNVHPNFANLVIKNLQKQTKLNLKLAQDLIESMQSQRQILNFASALKEAAIEVSRIASDLRLLSSGPNTGLAELVLPAVQPGSSIMPGKVNPSILECVNMVCYRVIGAETAIAYAVHGGQLDLNVNMPLMSLEALTSMKIFGNAVKIMAEKCIAGIQVNKEKCEKYAFESASLATALNPILGYAQVAEIVKEFVKTGNSFPEIILRKKLLTEVELKRILDPKKMTSNLRKA